MIPDFPKFKKLTLSDKKEIEEFTSRFPPYSDFCFASLWSWNTSDTMRASFLNGNLVFEFPDYLNGEKFYTFLGSHKVNATARTLIEDTRRKGMRPELRLLPEVSAKSLDLSEFSIEKDRDNFDYLYDLLHHAFHKGPALKNLRNQTATFRRRYPNYVASTLNLRDEKVHSDVMQLHTAWLDHSHHATINEHTAFARFLDALHHFEDAIPVGIYVDEILVALNVNVQVGTPQKYCSCLFANADTSYRGIYAVLMHETAHILLQRGYSHMNYEQDLGIDALRFSKKLFNPVGFLKKYRVSFNSSSSSHNSLTNSCEQGTTCYTLSV